MLASIVFQVVVIIFRGQPPPEAEFHYLENAKNLAMYGVHQFPALVSVKPLLYPAD